jgi:hypothetical protein
VVGLCDEVVFEVRTWVEHSVDTSERFEMFLDTNLTYLTDPPDTWSRLVFLAVERSAIGPLLQLHITSFCAIRGPSTSPKGKAPCLSFRKAMRTVTVSVRIQYGPPYCARLNITGFVLSMSLRTAGTSDTIGG